jgi:hypothetical protein
MKIWLRIIIILSVFFILCTCIDPYTPKLSGYTSVLVVDGLITNSDKSNIVKLSRTFQQANSGSFMVADATVNITDDTGNSFSLANKGNGIYMTDSLQFKGIPGRTYVLHIRTGDGGEYESDQCLMQPVSGIDSIYFEKDQQLLSNGTQSEEGIMIYLDSDEGIGNQYYRWSYNETWKFKVPNPKKYDYIKTADPNAPIIQPVEKVKEFCWKNRQSGDILIRSINGAKGGKILKQPVSFISAGQSDRLLIQYSIMVQQFSISKNEYDFWNNLKQVNETGSDIFAKQPYSVISNIHSTINPDERVLGYFQVSAVTEKREYILYRDVALLGLHFYSYPCRTWGYNPGYFETMCFTCPRKTWDDVIWYLTSYGANFTFIEPVYDVSDSKILKTLIFTTPECGDCELAGTSSKPEFWVDQK